MQRNKFDKSGRDAEVGSEGERLFASLCRKNSIQIEKSTPKQDKEQHIDAWVVIDGKKRSVDVKGAKRYSAEGLVSVELYNVNGKKGWLFGGAKYIAFQIGEAFALVPRLVLEAHVCRWMGIEVLERSWHGFKVSLAEKQKVASLPCEPPCYYARQDRPREAVTYISLTSLKNMIELVLK